MALERGELLKRIVGSAEAGQPLTARWLADHGVSAQLVHHYVRSGWLDRLGRGFFIRRGDHPGLEKSLAVGVTGGHVGGKTALAWHGHRHNLYVEERVLIYSHTGGRVAPWVSERFPVEIRRRKLFGHGDEFGVERRADGVLVSEPERAVLEMLSDVPGRQSLEEAGNLVDMLYGLRSSLMQLMLKDCLSVKAVRLFLTLARQSSLPVLDGIDLEGVRLGAEADYVMTTPEQAFRLKR